MHHRRRQIQHTLSRIEDVAAWRQRDQHDLIFNIQRIKPDMPEIPDDPSYMSVKDAIGLVVYAWRDVGGDEKPNIFNCFRRCKIRSEIDVGDIGEEDMRGEGMVDKVALAQLEALMGRLHHQSPMSIETLLNDDYVPDFLGEDDDMEGVKREDVEMEEEAPLHRRYLHGADLTEVDSEDDTVEAPKITVNEARYSRSLTPAK
ncbi:hypothetical protein BGZ95_009222 [Linnemannia exigua]|uniref:Uncharacterized protein n=1 Tax=Linnemannia exigua TaxID=604196 RepID=A0AAD4DKP8_9FUNG|nr:hypothetical protein BGZ95_009222 [Linnemannia exigua]